MFLEKYAKLKSEVENTGNKFYVHVFDDEISTNEAVMTLSAVATSTFEHFGKRYVEEDLPIIMVSTIDFEDELFFELSQERQDKCGVILLKRFIKYYLENYKGHLIGANFANYDLQEKFKAAVEKGIFPKESLKYIGETTQEEYDTQNQYNKDNRKILYEYQKDPTNIFSDVTIENNTIVNISLSNLINTLNTVAQQYPVFEEDNKKCIGYLNGGNVYFKLPQMSSPGFHNNTSVFYFYPEDSEIEFSSMINFKNVFDQNRDTMQRYFDIPNLTIQWYDNKYGRMEESLDELLKAPKTEASINRLKRLKVGK